ncbi:MAG TPA: dihydrodipicolinate synthase family protein [Acidobacteriota bacterium]|nr:dihydrodipicolinate synthase family protein [Acidobacteriota bacterium]
MEWKGVIPAITTPFKPDLSVDHEFLARHALWLIENGCVGIVVLGSLGEGATLRSDEKWDVLRTCSSTLRGKAPLVAGISALGTDEAVRLASKAAEAGCSGLMVLPPYVYSSDWSEMKAHIAAIVRATGLSCMLYNNPVSYKTDFLPEQIHELASEFSNLHAVKESSADVRRITAIRALTGDRLAVLAGVDDLVVEAVQAGAVGWIAGLVNALPRESVALFDLSCRGDRDKALQLYRWFLPLLRMDTVPKFVQLIKLVQQEVGMGSARVRPPRLELEGAEFEQVRATIRSALGNRPIL